MRKGRHDARRLRQTCGLVAVGTALMRPVRGRGSNQRSFGLQSRTEIAGPWVGFGSEGRPVREAANPPQVSLESGLPGLNWPEAQQRQPMRMALAGHQFARALAVAFGTSAAHEAPMVQEEPQQAQV